MNKLTLLLVVALALAGSAFAFHDRGVASCSGCHTMHNSQDGAPIDLNHPSGNPWLLIAASPSDVCLSCHANSFGSVLGNSPLAPPPERGAGNFVFLLEDNINDGPNGATNPILGSAAGHNINAPAHGLATDGTSPVSPRRHLSIQSHGVHKLSLSARQPEFPAPLRPGSNYGRVILLYRRAASC